MSISFESEEIILEKLRERLRRTTEREKVRKLAEHPLQRQLDEGSGERSGQFEQVKHRCIRNQLSKTSLKARSSPSASKSAISSPLSIARKVSIRSKTATSASSIFRFS